MVLLRLAAGNTLDPRPAEERDDFRRLLEQLQDAWAGSLRHWCRHSDIDAGKRDPGPGFSADWLEGSGLEWRPAGPRG